MFAIADALAAPAAAPRETPAGLIRAQGAWRSRRAAAWARMEIEAAERSGAAESALAAIADPLARAAALAAALREGSIALSRRVQLELGPDGEAVCGVEFASAGGLLRLSDKTLHSGESQPARLREAFVEGRPEPLSARAFDALLAAMGQAFEAQASREAAFLSQRAPDSIFGCLRGA